MGDDKKNEVGKTIDLQEITELDDEENKVVENGILEQLEINMQKNVNAICNNLSLIALQSLQINIQIEKLAQEKAVHTKIFDKAS